jgi:hypothetical protein
VADVQNPDGFLPVIYFIEDSINVSALAEEQAADLSPGLVGLAGERAPIRQLLQ